MAETRAPYSPNEVAIRLGVSSRTIRRWISEGRLPATRYGRQLRVSSEALVQLGAEVRAPDSWPGLSTHAFAEDWDNELDAEYDRWEEIYGPPSG